MTKIGIASHEEIKQRMLDVMSGKRKKDENEPKTWFTSQKALEDHGIILSEEEWDELNGTLDNPPPANEALKKAMKKTPPWEE